MTELERGEEQILVLMRCLFFVLYANVLIDLLSVVEQHLRAVAAPSMVRSPKRTNELISAPS